MAGAGAGQYVIGDAVFRISGDLSGLQQSIAQGQSQWAAFASSLTGGFGGIGTSALSAGRIFSTAFEWTGAARLATAFFDTVETGFRDITDAAVGFNSTLQQSNLVWTTLLKNGQDAAAMVRTLQDLSGRSGILFPTLDQDARKLGIMGEQIRNILPDIQAFANISGSLGLGSKGIDLLTQAVSRALDTQKVQTRDLLNLVRQGVPIWDLLSEASGKSIRQLQTDLKNGGLSAQAFVADLRTIGETKYADGVERQATTFTGALNRIKTNLMNFGATAFLPLFDGLTKLANRVADFVQTDQFQSWAIKIAAGVSVAIDAISSLATGFASGLGGVLSIVSTIGQDIYTALQWLNPFSRHSPSLVESVNTGVDQILAKFSTLASIASPLQAASGAMRTFQQSVSAGLAAFRDQQDQATAQTLGVFGAGAPDAYLNASRALRSLEGTLPGLQAGIDAQQSVVDSWKNKLDAANASIRGQEQAITAAERALRPYEAAIKSAQAAQQAATDVVDRQREAVQKLQDALSGAQKRYSDLANVQIAGSQGFSDREFGLSQQQAQTQLDLIKAQEQEERRRAALQPAIDAEQQAVDQATAAVTRHKDAVAAAQARYEGLKTALSEAQNQLQYWERAPLVGTRAFADQIEVIDEETAKLQLRLLNLKIANPDADANAKALQDQILSIDKNAEQARLRLQSLQDEAAGVGAAGISPELAAAIKQAQAQYAGLQQSGTAARDQLTNSGAGQAAAEMADLEKQIAALQQRAEQTKLSEQIQLGPLTYQLHELANTSKEVTFAEAAAGIQNAQRQIASLTPQVAGAEAAWKGEEAGLKGAEAALKDHQDRLSDLKKQYATTSPEVTNLETRLKDLQRQAEEVKLQESLQLDPLRRQLDQLKNPIKELPFDELAGKLRDAKKEVDTLQGSLTTQQDVLKRDEDAQKRAGDAVKVATAARDKQRDGIDKMRDALQTMRDAMGPVQERYDAENKKLGELQKAYQAVKQQITEWRSALSDAASEAKAKMKDSGDGIQASLEGVGNSLDSAKKKLQDMKAEYDDMKAKIRGWFEPLENAYTYLKDNVLKPFWTYFHDTVWNGIKDAWKTTRDVELPTLKKAWDDTFGVNGLGLTLKDFHTAWDKGVYQPLKDSWKDTKEVELPALKKAWDQVFGSDKGSLGDSGKTFSDYMQNSVWKQIKEAFRITKEEELPTLRRVWFDAFEGPAGLGAILLAGVNNIIGLLNGALKAVGAFVNGFRSAINWIASQLGATAPFSGDWTAPQVPTIAAPKAPGPGTGSPYTGQAVKMLAEGTPYFEGGAAIVGERGPELITNLPRGARVYSTADTMSMLGTNAPDAPQPQAQDESTLGKFAKWLSLGAQGMLDYAMKAFHVEMPKLPGAVGGLIGTAFQAVKHIVGGWVANLLAPLAGEGTGDALISYALNVMVPGGKLISGWGEPRPGGRTHEGIDIQGIEGSPVHTFAQGAVTFSEKNSLGGNIVQIKDVFGRSHYFAHLQQPSSRRVGEMVRVNDVMGLLGHSGDADQTVPHLHYQISDKGGVWRNPVTEILAHFADVRAGEGTDPNAGGSPAGLFYTALGNAARAWIAQALGTGGYPSDWTMPLSIVAYFESGGSPRAINLSDSNAQAGYPSRGIMQEIPQTYNAYRPGYARPFRPPFTVDLYGHDVSSDPGDIYEPHANILAAIEYILRGKRLRSPWDLQGVQNVLHGGRYVGYADGGWITEAIAGIGLQSGTMYSFGERERELVIPQSQMTTNTTRGGDTVTIHFHEPASAYDERRVEAAVARAMTQAGRQADTYRRV